MTELSDIEEKWQSRWAEKKIFESGVDKKRKKYFFTVPYPYISGSLHIGHSRVMINGDVHCRFKRMQGYNVLFPMAFHITGTPVLGISSAIKNGDESKINLYKGYVENYVKNKKEVEKIVKSFEEPWNIVNFFIPKMMGELSSLGLSIDWSRRFNTGEEDYKKMIEWQFKRYNKLKFLNKGEYPVIYCTSCKNAVGEDDIKDGDCEPVEKQEMVLLKFELEEYKKRFLVAATLRPETIFGQTNIWVDSNLEYVMADVQGEEWILSETAFEKLKYQKEKIKKIGKIKGRELEGKYAIAPLTKKRLVILPSKFIDKNFATGIVASVPSDAPYDLMALEEIKKSSLGKEIKDLDKIAPIPIIESKELGELSAVKICKEMDITSQTDSRLEEATQKVYKTGFHTGKMNKNCEKYSGMPVREAKEQIKKELVEKNEADLFFETSRTAICRCGGKIVVAKIKNQWFIDFNSPGWKEKALRCLKQMEIYPEKYRKNFEETFEWLDKRPVARTRGIGTQLPFDKKWIIESLSDSTIYMAFYTIKNLIDVFRIKPEQLTEEFFDYVYLGMGNPEEVSEITKISPEQLKEMRGSFDYWYPNDHRHTFVLHLSNHLSFFIFAHAGLFPQRYWPKKISIHGMIECEGSKMSKSKGNIVTLLDIKNKFGADVFRAYLATAACLEGDFNWMTEEVESMRKNVTSLYHNLKEMISNISDGKLSIAGKIFLAKFERWIEKATVHLEKMEHREYANIVLYSISNDYKKFLKSAEKKEIPEVNRQIIERWIKILCPLMPHIAEELWEKFNKKSIVSDETWPKYKLKDVDERLIESELLSERISEDINNILKLINKSPKKIDIILSPEWKFKVFSKISEFIKMGKLDSKKMISELMADKNLKKYGGEISRMVQKSISEPGKIPEGGKNQKEEFKSINEMIPVMEKRFGCKLEIFTAEKSSDKKAGQAVPGKPAILVIT